MGDLLQQHGRLIGTGSIRARLYEIDDPDLPGQNTYPSALPSSTEADRVYGEVYRLTASGFVLDQFDISEGCTAEFAETYEFMLRIVTVQMKNGRTQPAATYLYTWDVSNTSLG